MKSLKCSPTLNDVFLLMGRYLISYYQTLVLRGRDFNPPSPRLLINLPPDQHAADFAGAGADLVELGVAQQPAGGEIVDVAVAPKALDRLQRHPGRPLGGIKNSAGGVLAGDAAVVAGARDRVDIGLGGVGGHVHVGELGANELKLSDRLAELLALV